MPLPVFCRHPSAAGKTIYGFAWGSARSSSGYPQTILRAFGASAPAHARRARARPAKKVVIAKPSPTVDVEALKEAIHAKKRERLLPTGSPIRDAGKLGTSDEWDQAVAQYGVQTAKLPLQLPVADGTISEKISTDIPARPERLSPEARLGKKYQGLVTLPPWLQNAVQEHLTTVDKNHLRHHTLRLLDALRSTCGVAKESLFDLRRRKSQAVARQAQDDDGEVWEDGNEADGGIDRSPQSTAPAKVRSEPALKPLVPHVLTYGADEVNAYLAARLIPHYGAVANVFQELRTRLPDFQPHSVLDFGTGPGTAMWAALEAWDTGTIQRLLGVDISEAMLESVERSWKAHPSQLAKSNGPLTPTIELQRYFSYHPNKPRHQLVISAFTLGELPTDALRESTLKLLWDQTDDVLVLIDRGTKQGFQTMLRMRDWFIQQAKPSSEAVTPVTASATDTPQTSTVPHQTPWHFVAPCPHERACPLQNKMEWCHFSQQIQRPHFMMQAKKCKRNHEDIKYSYLVVRRGARPTAKFVTTADPTHKTFLTRAYSWPRLVFPSLKRGGHVTIDSCTPQGSIQRETFVKSDGKQVYKDARKLMWGDLLPHTARISHDRPMRIDHGTSETANSAPLPQSALPHQRVPGNLPKASSSLLRKRRSKADKVVNLAESEISSTGT
ncbi:37S ribosomal protein S22 [Dimargaris verticillata]|uniref:37S ribosomal protein S22 n=1 Tax=Dimargaris verticillata TaxID=2761393 RepID=A0A9W8B544_9FUNG|nr:37S ribosomal protein S22 [Dimargaris verticillata]